MTYEHRPSGNPASPDIDDGLPEVCEKCDRDCPEPCEAFKRFVAVTKWYQNQLGLTDTADHEIIELGKILESQVSRGQTQ